MSSTTSSTTTQYYVFSADNNHVGPVSADLIGRGVVAGKVPNDAFVAPLGSTQWVPLGSIPELNLAVSVARIANSSVRPSAIPGSSPISAPPPPAVPKDLLPPAPAPAPAAPAPGPASVSPQPAAAPAPAAAAPAAAAAAPKPAAAPAATAAKPEEKKPALDPRYKLLPLAIFGCFAFLGIVETAIALLVMK